MSVPRYRLEEEEVVMVCRYEVDEESVTELDIKWYLDSSPSPWLVHLPHHWSEAHVLADTRPTRHVSQVYSNQTETVVRLTGLTEELSGVYTCKVSTNTQETRARARLTVLSKDLLP